MLSFIFDYWYITIFTIIQIFILCYLYNKIKTGTALIKNNIYHIASSLALLVLFAGLCLAGMRGGFRHSTRPITLSNASKYTSSPDQRAIVLNTPFSIFRTLSKKAIKRYEFFTDDEISKIYKAKKTNTNTRDSITNKKPTNVVVIILESFSKEHFGFFNKDIKNYKGYTPFLDSLCNHSYVIQNSYANGRKSIDALPSILTSIPQIVEPFVLSHYSGNKINSIASVLKDKSYYSAFFHGAPNGSMGFQSFIKQAGFDDYFGKTEFNNNKEFDGMWGIWDEPFFQFYAEKMDSFKQPFVSAIFSVSSHHPYKVPEQHKGKFKEGKLPVQKSIGYTDYALKRFFEKAKTMDWYKNSLFVITADHSISPYLEKYKTTYNKFSVPIIFHKPNSDLIKNDSISIAQQIDIMPSILSILGYDKKYIAFGNSIFNKEDNYAIQYIGGLFQVLDKDYLLQFDGNNTTGFFNIKEDYFMKTNLVNQNLEIQKKYEQRIKAFLQEYSNRMLDNKLTIN
jgi:phosphoglycerol transferase MdoB-like AlkP superfamily enzyme